MLDVVKVASYISCRYGQPLFETPFQAWKYGPVLVQIRSLYKSDKLTDCPSDMEVSPYLPVFDKVFEQYAPKDANFSESFLDLSSAYSSDSY